MVKFHTEFKWHICFQTFYPFVFFFWFFFSIIGFYVYIFFNSFNDCEFCIFFKVVTICEEVLLD